MWSALGYPACAVAIPLLLNEKLLPAYMAARSAKAKGGVAWHSEICDVSLRIKDQWAFPLHVSNGNRYLAIKTVLCGKDGKPALLGCTRNVERKIEKDFLPLYHQWEEGALSDQAFFKWYDQIAKQWLKNYYSEFAPYL
jgi:hypothetical protein